VLWLRFKSFQARYAPAIVPIALTIPITIPAISPPVRLDELFDLVLGVWAAPTVVVECCVRITREGGAVEVTRAAQGQIRSDKKFTSMSRTLNSSVPMWPETSRSESHLLVVTVLPDDPNTDELVAVATSMAVDVTGDSVLLTTVVLAPGAAVEGVVGGLEFGFGLGLVVGVVTSPFTVAQYRE
jgi:hypothetical protein